MSWEPVVDRWETMNDTDRDVLVATEVMGWALNERNMWVDSKGKYTGYMHHPPHKAYEGCQNQYFKPTTDMSCAWLLAEKLGLAVIPQSHGKVFRWYVCDVRKVSYRGSETAIAPLEDAHISDDKATYAICLAALISVNQNKKEVLQHN